MTATSWPDESVEEFRIRLRSWLDAAVRLTSPDDRARINDAARNRTTTAMYDLGFIGLTWPTAYGGRGLPQRYQTVFNEETADCTWAVIDSSVTVGICAPTLRDYGTEKQKSQHIPHMLRADEAWTQLLSEPDAGSDLASISTAARLDGDHFVLNGQKVWTSQARTCEFALTLVRTDPGVSKRAGVSMLIIDLRSPGIDIRPLREMTGESMFNEVFLNDVQVPRENLVGPANGGWTVLRAMLAHERLALSAGTAGSRMDADAFPGLLAAARRNGVADDLRVRDLIVGVYIEQRLLDLTGSRIREASEAGLSTGPVGSIGKIGTARAARMAAEAAVALDGMNAIAWAPADHDAASAAQALLQFPASGIAGGTTEIQKNTVADRVLDLPRD